MTASRAWAGAALVAGLLGGPADAQRSADESIYPPAAYRAAEGRALATIHAGELRALYEAVRRCTPELDFHRHGIGFRRPAGIEAAPQHLAVWVWLPVTPPPQGRDLRARAADAFRRYGPRLLPHLVARDTIHADAKVGGYGLVLTWFKPDPTVDPPIGETLVVFAPKAVVVPFVGGTTPVSALLTQSRLRAFDGQTEVPLPALAIQDQDLPTTAASGC